MSTNLQARAAQTAERIAELSGSQITDKVTILGHGEIELLLAMQRRGFRSATCRGLAGGPHVPADMADIVIAPSISSEAELAAAAAEAKRSLKQGGLLVAGLSGVSRAAARHLKETLTRLGFAAIGSTGTRDGASYLSCRKLGLA